MSKPCRVAVGGLSPSGLYLLERLSLCSEIQVVGAFDSDPARLRMAAGLSCALWELPVDVPVLPELVDFLFVVDGVSSDTVSKALVAGQHVVIDQPWRVSSMELQTLQGLATTTSRIATTVSLRRWSADFVAALAAMRTGRIGTLTSARFFSCERRVASERLSASVLREFGYHWLDQLLVLVPSAPARVFGKRLLGSGPETDDGFLALIDFANGCTAQIEVNTNSRLGHRTGWMLEGELGSYRQNRLFTETTDGEIVDEPSPRSNLGATDPFLNELVTAGRGEPTALPTLAEAAGVLRLIEAIEASADRGEVVRL